MLIELLYTGLGGAGKWHIMLMCVFEMATRVHSGRNLLLKGLSCLSGLVGSLSLAFSFTRALCLPVLLVTLLYHLSLSLPLFPPFIVEAVRLEY